MQAHLDKLQTEMTTLQASIHRLTAEVQLLKKTSIESQGKPSSEKLKALEVRYGEVVKTTAGIMKMVKIVELMQEELRYKWTARFGWDPVVCPNCGRRSIIKNATECDYCSTKL